MSATPDATPSSVDCAIRAVIERIDDNLKRTKDLMARSEDLLARMEVLADAWSDALSDRKEPPLDTVH